MNLFCEMVHLGFIEQWRAEAQAKVRATFVVELVLPTQCDQCSGQLGLCTRCGVRGRLLADAYGGASG